MSWRFSAGDRVWIDVGGRTVAATVRVRCPDAGDRGRYRLRFRGREGRDLCTHRDRDAVRPRQQSSAEQAEMFA